MTSTRSRPAATGVAARRGRRLIRARTAPTMDGGGAVCSSRKGWHSTLDARARARATPATRSTVLTANGTAARARRHRSVRLDLGPTIASADVRAAPRAPRRARALRPRPAADRARDVRGCGTSAGRGALLPTRPPPWQQRLLRDKHALVEHMAARGIAVPRTRVEARRSRRRRPRARAAARGQGRRRLGRQRVRIVESRAALDEAVAARARARRRVDRAGATSPGPTYLFGGRVRRGARRSASTPAEKLEQHPPRTGGAIHLRSLADAALLDAACARRASCAGPASRAPTSCGAPTGATCCSRSTRACGARSPAPRSAGVDCSHRSPRCSPAPRAAADLAFAAGRRVHDLPALPQRGRAPQPRRRPPALRDLRGRRAATGAPRFVVHILPAPPT